jgi:hypothetical protein
MTENMPSYLFVHLLRGVGAQHLHQVHVGQAGCKPRYKATTNGPVSGLKRIDKATIYAYIQLKQVTEGRVATSTRCVHSPIMGCICACICG